MSNRYIVNFFLSTALTISGVAAVNFYADPLGLFRESSEESLSRIHQFFYMRTSRPVMVSHRQPNAVVIGSSITGRIRPKSSVWKNLSALNLSLPGVTLFEIGALVKHAHNTRALEGLVIGLDPTGFVLLGTGHQKGFNVTALESGQQGMARIEHKIAQLSLYVRVLTSFPSLRNSLLALHGPGQEHAIYNPDGSWWAKRPPDSIMGIHGLKTITQTHKAFFHLGGGAHFERNMEQYSKLLKYCYENNIDTHLYLNPNHALFLQLFEALNLMGMWQDWHHRIVSENLRLASLYSASPFPIWGFNDSKGIINEPVTNDRPPDDSWFEDGVHFRPQLGEIIMTDMLVRPETPVLGTRLTPSNLPEYLRSSLALKTEYEREHNHYVEDVLTKLRPRQRAR